MVDPAMCDKAIKNNVFFPVKWNDEIDIEQCGMYVRETILRNQKYALTSYYFLCPYLFIHMTFLLHWITLWMAEYDKA